jgi:Ca2+-binding EF-hand superfamily protein
LHRQRKREAKIADKGPGVFKKMHGALRIGVLEEHIGKAKVLAGETQMGKRVNGHVSKLLRRSEGERVRSEEEIEEDVEDLFGMLDGDGSGEITISELTLISAVSGAELTHSEVSALLREMDDDGDGSVIFEEFRHWAIETGSETADAILKAFAVSKNEEEEKAFELGVEVFEKIDIDQEGFILRSQLTQVPGHFGVSLPAMDVDLMVRELTGAATESKGEVNVDMDGFCEWLMGKSRVAAVLCGRDGLSKQAALDAENDGEADKDEQVLRTRVISGHWSSLTGNAFSSETLDTVRLCKGVYRGKWYYEVHLGEKRNMQIGYAMSGFDVEPGSGNGVGSEGTPSRSWAYDGGRQRKYSHGWISYGNAVKWKAGDVVGCLLDLQKRQVSFSVNGENLGVAFDEVWAKKTEPIYPAASLKGGPHMVVFENCLYAPDDYQLFADAPDSDVADYEEYAEAPVRRFLEIAAAQQAAAWLPAPEYMERDSLKGLPEGSPIIYADSGKAGEVTEQSYKGHHVVTLYEEVLAEGGTAANKVSKFTDNHLTVDQSFVDKYIAAELERGMSDFKVKQADIARSAERNASAFIDKGQREAAEAKKKETDTSSKDKKKKKSRKKREKQGKLNGKEQRNVKKQHMIFALLDTDGSGEISIEEMQILVETDGYDLTGDDIKRAMKEMDTDGSGEVGFDLFQLWLEEESPLAKRVWEQSNEKLLIEQESRVHLAAMGPEKVLIGGHIIDKADWATVRACRRVTGGRWYYEVLLGDGAACNIGFACTDMVVESGESEDQQHGSRSRSGSRGRGDSGGRSRSESPSREQQPLGVGEVSSPGNSWGYDGSSGVKMHKGSVPYAAHVHWKANDVVGCILDLDAGTIAYSLNGTYLGVAFRSVSFLGDNSIFPAMTLQGGPHWARFSRHELEHRPEDCRVFSTSLVWDEVKNRRESKIRRRAYRREKSRAENLKNAWVEPTSFSPENLVGMRIDLKGRGRGKVDKLNSRGKHEVTFDDDSTMTTVLGNAGFMVLYGEFFASHCNEAMADREKQLFEQRVNQALKKSAGAAAKQRGQEKQSKSIQDDDDNAVVFTNPLDMSFDMESQEDEAQEEDEAFDKKSKKKSKKKKKKKKGKSSAEATGDDGPTPEDADEDIDIPDGDDDAEEEEEEDDDEDLMEIIGEFGEDEGDYGGDGPTKKSKAKDAQRERDKEAKRASEAKKKDRMQKGGEAGADAAAADSGEDDDDDDGEMDIADNQLAPFFETLLRSREVKATAAIEGRKLALKQFEAWMEPPAAESAEALRPEDYVGRTIKYEKKGIGLVEEWGDGKKQRHTVQFQARKGKEPKVSKVRLGAEAAAEGLFMVLDEGFVEKFILQHIDKATAEFSKEAAKQILRDKYDRQMAEAKAARDEERRRKLALAKPLLLAPGVVAAKTVNTVVPLAGRLGFNAMRMGFAATVVVTGTALKATNAVAKVSESGVNQIEKQMGLLSDRQILALCEAMDSDGTELIGRAELARITMLLEEQLSEEEFNAMVLGVTGDEEGAEGVEYEAFGIWINSAGYIQDRLRPKAKGDLKEEADWVAGARKLTEQVARLRACRQDDAWVDGTQLKPKDIVGLPVDVPPFGQGIVESYSQPGKRRRKKKAQGHTIQFDIGEKRTIQLEFGGDKHLDEGLWKAVHYEYVNDYVDAALADFDAESQAMIDEVSDDAMIKVMDEELAWKPGDFNAEGGVYVGKYVQMGSSKRGYCEQFKSGKYTIKPVKGGDSYKVKLDGTGKVAGKGKKKKKQELFTTFRVLDDEFSIAFTVPLIQQQMDEWSRKQIAALEEEQAQSAEAHEDEVANQIDRYIEEMARQNLIAAATCVAHWIKVGTLGFETFRASFMPTAEEMDPEMISAAGGIEVILRQTWLTMSRSDRAIIENEIRKKQTDGAGELEGFTLGQGEVKQYQVYKATKMRRDFVPDPDAKDVIKGEDIIYSFTVGEKVTALERRVNDAGILRIRCEVEATDQDSGEHISLQGWVSVTSTQGEDILVPAEGHELQPVAEGTTIDLRDLDITCAIPGGLSATEIEAVYHELHASEKHPNIPLDQFAKWVVSKHSDVAAKILETAKGLKWGELAPLITYVNPDEEPEITEERYAKARMAAKGGFVVGSFALKAGVKTTKIAYKIAKPVSNAVHSPRPRPVGCT